jgi:orotate phosphoribosyltransferase
MGAVRETSGDRARLLRLLAERSIRLGDFVLASGARSSYYIDCRATLTHAEGQALAGRLGLAALRAAALRPAAVGGLTMGADPLAYAIAHTSWLEQAAGPPVHAFAVRKEPKAHGTGRRIEGSFGAGDAVVVIEDVITSGGSALRACEAVVAEGGSVLAVLALVDREAGGREAIEAAGYRVETLYRVSEVLEVARSLSASPETA